MRLAIVFLALITPMNTPAADTSTKSLMEAAARGDTAVVEALLKRGANVNARDNEGFTALIQAAYYGHTATVEALLAKGADPNAQTKQGITALTNAVVKGHTAIVEALLAQGANVDARDREGFTALINAAYDGQTATVEALVAKGADVNAKEKDGMTALMLAAMRGHNDTVKALVAKGADVNAKSNAGVTALMIAEAQGHTAVLQLLQQVEAGKAKAAPEPPRETAPPRSDVDTVPVIKALSKNNAYAVVIGIEQYREKLPKADFAARDARLMGDYLTKVLGYQEQNVIVRINERATKSDLTKYFEEWLRNNVETGGSVFVYYSGHGAPNTKTGEGYLVPYDGDPTFTESTAYPLKRLSAALDKLPAKDIVVVLDSCFSGAGGRSVLAKGARPMGIVVENQILASGKTMVLAASAGDEISNTFDEQGHGLLTYFFLKGLQGAADTNGDGITDMTELFGYVKPNVQRIARKQYNNEQTPQLLAGPTLLERGIRLIERAK